MKLHPYQGAQVFEKRAREKFDVLMKELCGTHLGYAEVSNNHDIEPLREGHVQTDPQEVKFAVDELILVLKEIRRIYGK